MKEQLLIFQYMCLHLCSTTQIGETFWICLHKLDRFNLFYWNLFIAGRVFLFIKTQKKIDFSLFNSSLLQLFRVIWDNLSIFLFFLLFILLNLLLLLLLLLLFLKRCFLKVLLIFIFGGLFLSWLCLFLFL